MPPLLDCDLPPLAAQFHHSSATRLYRNKMVMMAVVPVMTVVVVAAVATVATVAVAMVVTKAV